MRKKIFSVSGSQLETAQSCVRKWLFTYGPYYKAPMGDVFHFQLGTVVHKILENWLKSGDANLPPQNTLDWGVLSPLQYEENRNNIYRILTTSIRNGVLFRPPGFHAEYKFQILLPSASDKEVDIYYSAVIDVLAPGLIWDFKTTSDIKWAKKASEISTSVKDIMYTWAYDKLYEDYPKLTEAPVEYSLIYIPHRTATRKEVAFRTATIEPAHRAALEPTLTSAARSLYNLSEMSGESFREIPLAPIEECNKYRGCQFSSVCHRGVKWESYKRGACR